MSDPRDDLAALIHSPRCCPLPHTEDYRKADAILAAGWVKPEPSQLVSTLEELMALPDRTILDINPDANWRADSLWQLNIWDAPPHHRSLTELVPTDTPGYYRGDAELTRALPAVVIR